MARDAANQVRRVLFLCTGNSCRSQMAQGWANALLASTVEAHSAGTCPGTLNPLAVRAMREVGIDISHHVPRHVNSVRAQRFDLVVTVCDAAHDACPVFPGAARVLHHAFDDPPHLAASARSDEEAMPHYRRVRDEVRAFVASLASDFRGVGPDGTSEATP